MFERYTERARRLIFFARYEAAQFGSPYIEAEHLLLGLLRDHNTGASHFLPPVSEFESMREQIKERTSVREKLLISVDLPLSQECKQILAHGAEEADSL